MKYTETIGSKCPVCRKGIIFYFKEEYKDKSSVEIIGCSNDKCNGYVDFERHT